MRAIGIAAGFYRCPVCNRRHGDSILEYSQLRAAFGEDEEFMGWALCPYDEALHLHGFIALIEVEDTPEGIDANEQLDAAESLRTGNVFHILRDRWETFIGQPPPGPHMPVQFITPRFAADVREVARLTTH